jgi:hypothetical protein
MMSLLYYAKYKESSIIDCLLASRRLIQKSLNLDNSCVKLRAATFFLTNLEYSQAIEICDTFLTFPPTHKVNSGFNECFYYIEQEVHQQLRKVKTTAEIANIMKEILPMFYNSIKLKCMPGNYDITQQNPVWTFRNLTNIVFHGLYIDVTFMTAEKFVVPNSIQYELLSLSQDAEIPFSGIHLDPMFVCIQTKFLCYHSMVNVNGMAEMILLMGNCIIENKITTKPMCIYLNMLVYCLIKAGHHRLSANYILLSLRIFPSRCNAASGYMKIVLQILNSLSI